MAGRALDEMHVIKGGGPSVEGCGSAHLALLCPVLSEIVSHGVDTAQALGVHARLLQRRLFVAPGPVCFIGVPPAPHPCGGGVKSQRSRRMRRVCRPQARPQAHLMMSSAPGLRPVWSKRSRHQSLNWRSGQRAERRHSGPAGALLAHTMLHAPVRCIHKQRACVWGRSDSQPGRPPHALALPAARTAAAAVLCLFFHASCPH